MPPITPEFVYVAIAVGAGTAIGVYMAARPVRRALVQDIAPMPESDQTDAIKVTTYRGDTGMVEQLDLEEAIANRDAVLDAVADNNKGWLQLALVAMQSVPEGTIDTGEGFRRRLLEGGLPEPTRPNAWGAMVMTLTRRGILVRTGERRPMLDPKAHGRSTDVYRKCPHEASA